MISKQKFTKNMLRNVLIGVILFLIFIPLSTFSLSAYAQDAPCAIPPGIIPPGGTEVVCPGSISYPIAQFFDAGNLFSSFLKLLVGIVVTAAFFYFFWNLVKYIRDQEDKEQAKTKMGYSLAAIFVIVSLWGIIGFARGILGIGTGEDQVGAIPLPSVSAVKCKGNNTFVSYKTLENKLTTDSAGNAGICKPKNSITSLCCKSIKPGTTNGLTKCTDKAKCSFDGQCDATTDRLSGSAYNEYDCS